MGKTVKKNKNWFGVWVQSLWPSLRRTLVALFSFLGLPLFVLAVLGTLKLLNQYALIDLTGYGAYLVHLYNLVSQDALNYIAIYGPNLPPYLLDLFLIYLSFGNPIARAERNEIMATTLDRGERREILAAGFSLSNAGAIFLLIPTWMRNPFLRVFWPLVAIYRLANPYVVEGPGPSGDDISSTVPRAELLEFVNMVAEAGQWENQTLYDQRLIVVWHGVVIMAAAAAAPLIIATFSGG